MTLTNPAQYLSALADPLKIQAGVLTTLENTVTNGAPISSGDSVAAVLIQQFATITANMAEGLDVSLESLYAKRAQTMDQLLKHTSDYDNATSMFSTPASTMMLLMFSKTAFEKLVMDTYSQEIQTRYNIVIPRHTMFNIGKYQFGLQDAIYLQFDRETASDNGMIVFKGMSANYLDTVLNMHVVRYSGVDFITLQIPVEQFDRNVIYDSVVPPTGFTKTYTFSDRFNKMKVYNLNTFSVVNADGSQTIRNEWVPVEVTLSDNIYDPSSLTVKLSLNTDNNTANVSIPYVYISNKQIDNALMIELYTTKGAVDLDISSITSDMVNVNFQSDMVTEAVTDASGNVYNVKSSLAVLKQINPMILRPQSTKIVGGSNGLTFAEFKSRVINNSFHTGVLVTPSELESYMSDAGFTVTKEIDGLTNRRYGAYKALTHDGVRLASAFLTSILNTDELDLVNRYENNLGETVEDTVVWTQSPYTSFMITPNALYKYDATSNTCQLVSAAERYRLSTLSRQDLITEFNNTVYTISPFHMRIDTSYRYPLAYTYDLMKPTVDTIQFVKENAYTADQLSIYQASIQHNESGTAGFSLVLWVKYSDSMVGNGTDDYLLGQALAEIEASLDPNTGEYDSSTMSDYLRLKFQMISDSGKPIVAEAFYNHEASKLDTNGNLVFILDLNTTYLMKTNHKLNITSFATESGSSLEYVALNPTLHGVFSYTKEAYSGSDIFTKGTSSVVSGGYELLEISNFVALARQKLDVTLGRLVTEVHNPVTYTYTEPEYRRRYTTQFAVYPADQYQRDADGIPQLTSGEQVVVNGETITINRELIRTHYAGDVICTPQCYVLDHDTAAYNKLYTLQNETDHLWTALSHPSNIWEWSDETGYVQMYIVDFAKWLAEMFLSADAAPSTPTYWAAKVSTLQDLDALGADIRYAYVAAVGGNTVPAEFQMVTRVPDDTVIAIYRRESATSAWIKYVEHTTLEDIVEYIDAYKVTYPNAAFGYAYVSEGQINSVPLPEYLRIMSPTVTDWKTLDADLNQITGWPWDAPVKDQPWLKVDTVKPTVTTFTVLLKSTPKYLAETGFIDVYRHDNLETPILTAAQQEAGIVFEDGVTQVLVTADITRPVYSANASHTPLITAEDIAAGLVDVNDVSINLHVPPETVFTTGDLWLDATGNPLTVTDRSLLYRYGAIHVDAKLAQRDPIGTEIDRQDVFSTYLNSIGESIRGYLTTVAATKLQLLENTDLVFKPFRAIGLSSYTVNSANLVNTIDLECRIGFRLLVPKHVSESSTLKATITEEILAIVDTQFNNTIVSATTIAEQIRAKLPDYIYYVDVFGFNPGVTDKSAKIQTLINTDASIRPVLKTVLSLDDFGHVIVGRGLELEWMTV